MMCPLAACMSGFHAKSRKAHCVPHVHDWTKIDLGGARYRSAPPLARKKSHGGAENSGLIVGCRPTVVRMSGHASRHVCHGPPRSGRV